MDGGSQRIEDADELAAVRRQARRVVIKASVLTALLQLLVLWL